jgi:hypothetical protein
MDALNFYKRLAELLNEIATLPASDKMKIQLLVAGCRGGGKQHQEGAGGVDESLDCLRVAIKYLVFDLEATRRENSHLRKMLGGQTGRE